MIFSVEISGKTYKIDTSEPLDISIPLDFAGAQPNAFGVRRATANACEVGSYVGDTRRGGSCNFEEYNFVTHCSTTHTECVGHITDERVSLFHCLTDSFIAATLITVEPEKAASSADKYSVDLGENDYLITRKSIENALKNIEADWLQGLIVRTLPNDDDKIIRNYADNAAPFFSLGAMRFIREKNIKHLLVDVPSLDRADDGGHLAAHRIFWNVPPGAREISDETLTNNTITEMIFVPDSIADGAYLLDLQTVSFVADAAPSRPLFFKVSK